MIGDSEPVGLVPDALNQIQPLGTARQDDGLRSVGHKKLLVFLGQGGQRYVIQAQL